MRFCVRHRNTCVSTPNPVLIADGTKYFGRTFDSDVLRRFHFYRSYSSLPAYSGLGLLNPAKPVDDTAGWQVSYDAVIKQSSNVAGTNTVYTVDIPGDIPLSFVLQPGGDFLAKPASPGGLLRDAVGQFYFRHPDNTLWRFGADGRLSSIHTASGTSVQLVYANGKPQEAIDSFGRHLGIALTAKGTIDGVTIPDGRVIDFLADESGRFTGVQLPDGIGGSISNQYHYEDSRFPGAVTGETDELGHRLSRYTYDNIGRVTKSVRYTAGAQEVDTYLLDFSGNDRVVTDPLGSARTMRFRQAGGVSLYAGQSQPGGSGCNQASSSVIPDTAGNPLSSTDFNGWVTCTDYDPTRSLLRKKVEGLARYSSCGYFTDGVTLPTGARKTSTSWHPDWRLEVKRAEPKKLTTWVYNGQPDPGAGDAIASCAPGDALLPDGKPIAVLCKKIEQATTDASGTLGFAAAVTGTARTWTWTYNRHGQVLSEDGPRTDIADTTTYTYYADTFFDGSGVGHTLGDLWTVTNAKGQVTEFTQYDKHGHPLEIIDPNGLVTRMSYHVRGWLTGKSVGPAGGPRQQTDYEYDAAGQLKQVTNPDGSHLVYTYDAAHRLTDVTDSLGNSIHYTLDAMGNRTREEVTDPNGTLVRSQRRVYDALNRVQNLVTPAQ